MTTRTSATKPATVDEYLRSIPEDRARALEQVRAVILKNLDPNISEGIQYGMVGYFIPHSVYPGGYHCDPQQPLPFASLASQKNHMGIYLFCLYCDQTEVERFQEEWKATGKKLDMGKSCIRFKKIEDVPLDVLGRAIKRMTSRKFIRAYEAGLGAKTSTKAGPKKTPKKTTTRKAQAKEPIAKKTPPKKAGTKKVTKKTSTKKTTKKASKKAIERSSD